MRVYKFLDANYAISNIMLRRLKISRIDKLNDPFEFLAADLDDPLHASAFAAFKHKLSQEHGIVCFSKSWWNPLLWGHYADSHKGIVLGFEVADDKISEVRYTTERTEVKFDVTQRKIIEGPKLVDNLVRTKFIDWKYEEEYRLFVRLDRETDEGGNYFCEFSSELLLAEVILGLHCAIPASTLRESLALDFAGVTVLKAKMALKEFKVIEDR